MKKIIVACLAATTFLGAAVTEAEAGYRGRYYGPYYHHHHNDYGGALAAGVVGLAAGAMIAGAMANQPPAPPPPATMSPSLAAYCARKYRSFDPVTGTYLAHTGERIVCTY
jgi:hypothetical protein